MVTTKKQTKRSKKQVAPKTIPSGQYELSLGSIKMSKEGELKLLFKDVVPIDLDVSQPTQGHVRFFVACQRLGVYTSIGAENIHHASNKATKNFGPHWDFIRRYDRSIELRDYEFVPVGEFSQLLAKLPK